MQPAHPPDRLVPGPKIEVIRIAENNLRAQPLDHVLRNGFDAAGRPHRHEYWRFHPLMRQLDLRSSPTGIGCVYEIEREAHHLILTKQKTALARMQFRVPAYGAPA